MITKLNSFPDRDLEQLAQIWLNGNLQAHSFIPAQYWKNQFVNIKKMLPEANIFVYRNNETIIGFLGELDGYIFLVDDQTKYERFFVRSSMVLEKRGTISEDEIRLFFSSFCMTKRKIFCPFYFYKMGRWRLRKANRHNPKGIKGESETSPFSSHIVIQERSNLYYNVIACSIYGFIFSILL